MLKFGNTICAAQIAARPKSSILFHDKLSIYVSPMVSAASTSKLPWSDKNDFKHYIFLFLYLEEA